MKKKICLIVPDSVFLLDARVFPFLGILKVAAAWEKKKKKIDVIDLSGIENPFEVLNEYFSNNKDIEFVGLTATTPQMAKAYELGSFIKQNWHYKLVLGGAHATLMHTASKREKDKGIYDRASLDVDRMRSVFDVLVCGDGELTLDLIKQCKSGIVDADDRYSPLFLTDEKFSELPNPARHLIDLDSYNYHIEGERATSLIAQLGCPFKCTFCSGRNSPYLRKIRNRSTESIIHELDSIYKTKGYKGYMFYDDELNVSKTMVQLMRSISDLSNKHGVDFKLRGFTKSELFTEDQAKAMYDAGFRWLLTGFESGDERILTNIQKNAARDDNTRCVEIAKKHGLKVKALMSCGHAGETEESIENTKKWLLEVQPDDFDLTVISTFPGSPYFDDAVYNEDKKHYEYTSPKTGDKLYQKNIDYTKDAQFYKGIPGEYTSYVWTDSLRPGDLVKLRDNLESEVRQKLGIPYNPSNPARKYEHSMGSSANMPDWILRSTETHKAPEVAAHKTGNKNKTLKVIQ